MASQTKRYIITYTDENITQSAAESLLGLAKSKSKDAVSFMETESVPSKNDVLHFEKLGVSSMELTEDETKDLMKKDGVLAIEEDIEMFAINENNKQFEELFMGSDEEAFETEPEPNEDHYMQGYNKALVDVFSSLLQANSNNNDNETAGFFPPRFSLKPILPKIPPRIIRNQPIPWNISLIKAPTAWAKGVTGNGVKVAILDTGIASHIDLPLAGGVSFIPRSTSFNDLHGHGTHCAGIVAAKNNILGVVGVAPSSSLYAVKVLSDSGSGQSSWIIAGMEWCIRNGIKVASMSLGGASGPRIAYAQAVKRCQDNGVTVVVASGNSYGSSFPWVCSPANSVIAGQANASPIAVGAVNKQSAIASFSSRGAQSSPWNHVTCVAPGVSINSTAPNAGYTVKSGTSMACPHVAGLAALIIQRYPGITPANVKRRISTTCRDLYLRGYDTTYGYGIINCDAATE